MGERTKRRLERVMRRDRRTLKGRFYPGEHKRYPFPKAWKHALAQPPGGEA